MENEKKMIEDQFINDKGTWITDFNTEEEYIEQMSKVRQTIRETTTDRDFNVLDDYLYLLKRNYTNFLMGKERKEFK